MRKLVSSEPVAWNGRENSIETPVPGLAGLGIPQGWALELRAAQGVRAQAFKDPAKAPAKSAR